MGALQRVKEAWVVGGQAKALQETVPPPGGHSYTPRLSWLLQPPAGYVDTSTVGNGLHSTLVTSCLTVLATAFAESPATVYAQEVDQEVPVRPHLAAQLLRQPNPLMTGGLLWDYIVAACWADGDAWLWKARNGARMPVQLWPLPPSHVEPRDGSGSLATPEERAAHQQGRGALACYYEYTPAGIPMRLELDDVVHLRLGLNPDDSRKGRAPLQPVLREVLADEEAGQFATALLQNMGVPGVVITPKEGEVGPTGDDADAILDEWQDRFGGQRRGRPLYIEGGALNVQVLSFSPAQMDLKALRRLPEERVSAATGVPAILAGLGAGLDSATYSNARELREFFTESTVVPRWQLFGEQLTAQLLTDFDTSPTRRLGFDMSAVRALQEDQNALWDRAGKAVAAGFITVAEGKRMVGLDPYPEDEVYLRGMSVEAVPAGELAASQPAESDTDAELEALLADRDRLALGV